MRISTICFYGLFQLCSCNCQKTAEPKSVFIGNNVNFGSIKFKSDELTDTTKNKYYDFDLYYASAGLGSNMGSMQPTFRVTGTNYVYSFEQNSFYDKPTEKPELICKGKLRISSIDSIVGIVKDIKDTLIYNTNIHIMSGGIQTVSVKYKTINVTFELHNASDSRAQQIIDILNSNIPADKKRLWLSGL